jgi:adenosylmethionine---8-amino-7-oxononanoate aminotransferase
VTRLIAVTGTDTGAGKTVVTAALAGALRHRGMHVDALKLVATGVTPGDAGEDAALLARAVDRLPHECVIETYALPRSPLAAATADGRSVDVASLVRRVQARASDAGTDILFLEGVGGLLVPLTAHATVRDVLMRLDAQVLVVARAGLGTINHCALSVESCRNAGLRVIGVVMSDVEGVDAQFAAENAAQVARQCGVPVFGVLPYQNDASDTEVLARAAAQYLDLDALTAGADPHAVAKRSRQEVIAADRAHVWHPFTQTIEWRDEDALVIGSGRGSWLFDVDGQRYLDGVASLWANVHGHAHPALDQALREQTERIAHSTFLGLTHEHGALLAAELCAVAPAGLTRVFYSEAGAAAVEVALRVALLAQRHRGQSKRTRFVSLEDAYHGDTAGAVSVGRSQPFHGGLEPLLFDALRVPPPHLAGEDGSRAQLHAMFERHGETVAALVIEPRMQAAAGMWPHTDAWLRDAVTTARQHGALIVCDEVATGFGRTGDLFASTGAGVAPDILVLGKGLTGGYLPLSATLVTEELFDLFTAPYPEHRTLYYGHTYSGNPLACAVARASLRLFATEHTLARADALGAHMSSLVREVGSLPVVRDVRQRGVMVGIELCDEDGRPLDAALRIGRRVTLVARRRHVIVRPLGDVVVINPPLAMSSAEADLLFDAVTESIAEVTAPAAMAVVG